jgi:hypothetical protein
MTQEQKEKWRARISTAKAQGLRAHQFVMGRPDWMLTRISELNITNFRTMFTMVFLWGPTCWRYVTAEPNGWKPSIDWLGALLVMSGIDSLQYYGKRKTWKGLKSDDDDAQTSPPTEGA